MPHPRSLPGSPLNSVDSADAGAPVEGSDSMTLACPDAAHSGSPESSKAAGRGEGIEAKIERAWDGEENIPMPEWGKDHWSTLAYVESVCVDHGGVIANDRMRVEPRRHRKYIGPRQLACRMFGGYPAILAGGMILPRHDDWDCVNDMIAARLVELVEEKDCRPDAVFGGMRVTVRMTALGLHVSAQLRAHKASGGSFSDFRIDSLPYEPETGEDVHSAATTMQELANNTGCNVVGALNGIPLTTWPGGTAKSIVEGFHALRQQASEGIDR